MAGNCPSFSNNGVPGLITSQIDKVFVYGNNAYNVSMAALQSIKDEFSSKLAAQALNLTQPAPVPEGQLDLPDYQPPEKPEADELVFTLPAGLSPPPSFTSVSLQPGTAPTFTDYNPTFTLPQRPNALTAVRPESPGSVTLPTYPADPTLTLPPVPTLRSFGLPTAPAIDVDSIIAEFQALYANRPTAPDTTLNENILATIDQQYALVGSRAQAFVDQCPALANLCPRLGELLSGESIGIPVAVETAMRERALGSEDLQAQRAEKQVIGDWLARGFTLPAGVLDAKIIALRSEAWDKKTAANRDIWIESAKFQIDNLRFAIQQGIALEGQYWDWFLKLYDQCRTIAASLFDAQYKAVMAKIEVFKAELTELQSYADFFKAWLQAELSKLDAYKSELEGKKLLGELNQQDVDIYRARLEGLVTQTNLFKTQVEAATSRLQGELAKIEVFKAQIQAYGAEVGAYETEWKAYGQAVQGELGKTEILKALTAAFASRVDAYKVTEDNKRAHAEFEIDVQKLRLEQWGQEAEHFKTLLSGETARVDAETRIFTAKTGLFSSEVQGESVKLDVASKEAGLRLQAHQIEITKLLEEARLAQQQAIESARIAVQAMGEIGRVAAQLSAGSLSALNMSASMGNSVDFRESSDCNTTHSYSY